MSMPDFNVENGVRITGDGDQTEVAWTAKEAQEEAVLICTNNREQTIPAGLLARALPFPLVIAGVVAAMTLVLQKRRHRRD